MREKKKMSNFAVAKGEVALVSTIQLAEMESFSPFEREFKGCHYARVEKWSNIYTLLILIRNARINWKENRNDFRIQCRG